MRRVNKSSEYGNVICLTAAALLVTSTDPPGINADFLHNIEDDFIKYAY